MLRCVAAWLFVAICCPSALPQNPVPRDDIAVKLNRQVANYSLGPFNLVGALIKMSNDFQIPMGISWINSPTERAGRSYAWKNATVLEMIHELVTGQPGYRVDLANGVLHVSPGLQIPDSQNFLAMRVDSFQVRNEFVELAAFRLHMLLAPPARYGQISIGGTADSKVNIDLKDVSAAKALDALIAASNRKIWIVTFSSDPTLNGRGLRSVESLWGGGTPEKEQPGWDLLRWKDPLPTLAGGAAAVASQGPAQ